MLNEFQYLDDLTAFFVPQTVYATPVMPTTAHGYRCLTALPGRIRERLEPMDNRATRSLKERVEGRTPVHPWSTRTYLRMGAAGALPEIHFLLLHAFGSHAVDAGVSVTYSLISDLTGKVGTFYRGLTDLVEGNWGAVVQRLNITWDGNGFLMFEFSGVAADHLFAGVDAADGTGSGDTALVVDDANHFTKWAPLQIAADTNGDVGYQVTADPNHTTEALTISPATSWADADEVKGWLPTATFSAGAPVIGTQCGLTLDDGAEFDLKVVSGSISCELGTDLYNEEADTEEASDVIMTPSLRNVAVDLKLLAKKSEAYLGSYARRNTQLDAAFRFGPASGRNLVVNMNQLEFDPQPLDSPDRGPARWSLQGRALGTGSGENELNMVLT